MTKILFLDVDGVLNTDRLLTVEAGTYALCDERIAMLNAMLEAVGAKVVLSSSWRRSKDHVAFLEEHNALKHKHEDWCTGEEPCRDLDTGVYLPNERGREVKEWLSRHPEVTQYAIVDDLEMFLPEQMRYFVRTSPSFGLGKKHVRILTRLLS